MSFWSEIRFCHKVLGIINLQQIQIFNQEYMSHLHEVGNQLKILESRTLNIHTHTFLLEIESRIPHMLDKCFTHEPPDLKRI
jgi:hypothetical protein